MKSMQKELVVKGLSDAHTGEIERKNTRAKGKPKEQLSDRDWAELMGVNRDTFKRYRGSVRRR